MKMIFWPSCWSHCWVPTRLLSLSVGTALAALASSCVAWLAVGATVMLASFSAAVVSALAVVVFGAAASWAGSAPAAVAAGSATLAAGRRLPARPWFRSC
jgi:branched-subunit amino acid ABC-type transport system permease component